MIILKGDNGADGGASTPRIYVGATLKFTGTLRQFSQKRLLSDFTITEVDGTIVSQSASDEIIQTQIVGSLDTPLVGSHTADTYEAVNLTTVTGTGAGAEATVIVNSSGDITSVVITDGGSGYDVGDELDIPGSTIGGLNQGLTLTLANMLPAYEKELLTLKKVYIKAEDVDVTTGPLRFRVYNTFTWDLNYKYAIIFRIWNNL